MSDLDLDLRTTALVLIDLQKGIISRDTTPYSASEVVARAAKLAKCFREIGAPVVLVRVKFSADDRDRLKAKADDPALATMQLPPDFSELAPELVQNESDLLITKKQWGAFYGTELDLQLRRRGITTIVIGGIATNFGVESTARDAWERGYELVFVEDAMSGLTPDAHAFAVTRIFPRLGRVRRTADVIQACGRRL